jgi:hypothetical protein
MASVKRRRQFSWRTAFVFLCALWPAIAVQARVCAGEVTVRTVKDTYRAGETVEIVLANGSGESIRSLARSAMAAAAVRNLETKNPRGIWDAFFLKSRRGSDADFERAGEIRAGESVTFVWKPAILENGAEKAPGPGLYRLTVIYHKGSRRIFGTAKSNEFRIE